MALGTKYDNNQKNYSPTVYSQYGFSNPESNVDATRLSASFWNGFLKLTISPKIEGNGDQIKYDSDNGISTYLTHTKARILHDMILQFMKDPNQFNNVGVDSGAGLISLSNGKEFGVNGLFIVIRKINGDDGKIEASAAYHFKVDYHYSIQNFNEKDCSFDKTYHNDIEIEQFIYLLRSYYESMTGAVAYSMIDNMKYDNSRMNTKIGLIMDNLGIEKGSSSRSNKSSNSIFKNGNSSSSSKSYSNSTLDDIEDMI